VRRAPKPQRAPRRQRLKSRDDAVVTSMILPRDLRKRAMTTAYDLNGSMAEVVRQAVAEWLGRNAETARRGQRS